MKTLFHSCITLSVNAQCGTSDGLCDNLTPVSLECGPCTLYLYCGDSNQGTACNIYVDCTSSSFVHLSDATSGRMLDAGFQNPTMGCLTLVAKDTLGNNFAGNLRIRVVYGMTYTDCFLEYSCQ